MAEQSLSETDVPANPEAPVLFNINDQVRVKLTEAGLALLRAQHEQMNIEWRRNDPFVPPKVDADGWTEYQLWDLMFTFGQEMHMGNFGRMPFETTIQLMGSPFRHQEAQVAAWRAAGGERG